MTTFDISRRVTLAGLAAAGAAACTPRLASAPLPSSGQAGATALLDAMAWRLLELSPEGATDLGIDTGAHAGLRSRMGERSAAGMAGVASLLREELRRIAAFDKSGLDAGTRTSLAVVETAYRTALDGFAMPYGDVAVGGYRNTPYVVIQNVGAYLDVPKFLESTHPIREAADAEAYLSRLAAFPALLDGETERVRRAQAKGVVPPKFLLDKTAAQLDQMIATAAAGTLLVTAFAERTRQFPGNWQARAAKIVTGPVHAALQRQRAAVARLQAKATMDAGMWAQPHGDAFYAWCLRASTTTALTPDEVHARGREELAAIHARMDPILRKLGFTSGGVGERMNALAKDQRFHFPPGAEGRRQIVAQMQNSLDFIRGKLPLAFRNVKPGNLQIVPIPDAEAPGAPGAYGGAGSIDGKIPGKVWLNLSEPWRHMRYSVPDLGFHEGIPGHVLQGEYAQQQPLIRAMLAFNAYSEGWALYAEQLADELGAYENDEVGRLGYLQSLAFRACRMVVDTGLHAKRWTRQQGVDFFVTQNGSNPAEVASEVDRYCSWPGQACGYKMGHTEIVRQRAMAQAALGERYDLRDFNQAVVDGGNVPLNVLGENVDRYIAAARA